MSYRSNFMTVGGTVDEPDYVYYNADIINNSTDDLPASGLAPPDPLIRFNETRDTALLKDCSKYHFSIIRFTMNGANRDLPLFIPNIQTGVSQNNPDLTNYSVAISYQQSWATATGQVDVAVAPDPTYIIYESETLNASLAPVPATPVLQQDLSTRYYWVYTYQHWIDLVNDTFNAAHNAGTVGAGGANQGTFAQFQAAWTASGTTSPFPYANFAAFQANVNTPQMIFNEEQKPLFSIYGDSDGFGTRLEPFVNQQWSNTTAYLAGAVVFYLGVPYVAVAPVLGTAPGVVPGQWNLNPTAVPMTAPTLRLFFNTNMYGLFANFANYYWNRLDIPGLTPTPEGYTNEILFRNKFYQNVADFRVAPYSGVPPLGFVPLSQQKVYWVNTQDYKSTDSLWSPISSIVFTTSLIPVKTEATGQPNVLGVGNLGDTRATSQSAFQPIITDIALDTSAGGADDYRQFIYYAPNAEYRMADFAASKQELRNIDIQVFWKNRLNNQLYPVSMYNLSSVSLKIMFRKKTLDGKGL